ncbi:4-oxalomesaconate tautomerase [Corynebacterium glutamicum]|uniref:4-oxalomesaconate tautomerase n=1 Tax=Corynebacterium glutamicum TaxID=1718 RepID=UPI0009D6C9A7|nr:4-oxalomesaconate tautomerase [Corynebacterium glutamicum]
MTSDSALIPARMFNSSAYAAGTQTAIPCLFMRGGSSRGPFFNASDLPEDPQLRDLVLLAALGSPHKLQVDGLGGGHPLTSKAGIVSCSVDSGVDLDFTFAQLQPSDSTVQTSANCGNMLAAVVPFAIETGLITPTEDTTTATVKTINTGLISSVTVSTPLVDGHRTISYAGSTTIAGVNGNSAPVSINFLDTAGSIAPGLFPTGNHQDVISLESGKNLTVTMIDNGQPMVIIPAKELGISGYESPDELNAYEDLKALLEELRLKAGVAMELGDVSEKSYPKMTIISPSQHGGIISTRSFIPHKVHESIGVLAAITVAAAACTKGTIAFEIATPSNGIIRHLLIEHPSGSFEVDVELDANGNIVHSGNTRTARLIMAGHVYIPRSIWDPSRSEVSTSAPAAPRL